MADKERIRTKVTAGVITGIVLAALGYAGRAWWPSVGSGIVWFFSVIWVWLRSGHPVYGWVLVVLTVCSVAC
jgi:predicted anti-sigma-YlaC factor YlaD